MPDQSPAIAGPFKEGDAVMTREMGNALVSDAEADSITIRFANGAEVYLRQDGHQFSDKSVLSSYDIVARLVPDTGAEKALRLLSAVIEAAIRNGGGAGITWDGLGWDCEAWDDAGKLVKDGCGRTPLAAVEAAADALGVELGEGE